jgi:hypothetical protein
MFCELCSRLSYELADHTREVTCVSSNQFTLYTILAVLNLYLKVFAVMSVIEANSPASVHEVFYKAFSIRAVIRECMYRSTYS